jgi:predicted nuclease with TOPRIM domain
MEYKMKINPIKALKDSFEELIVEHGSAKIRADHIKLLKDQLSIAETETAKLVTKNSELETKISDLQTDIDQLQCKIISLKGENEDLKNKIHEYEQSSHNLSPTEIKQKIIFYLENNPRSSVQQISASTGIASKIVSDLLEQYAIDGDAICSYDSPNSDPLWTLHIGIPVT